MYCTFVHVFPLCFSYLFVVLHMRVQVCRYERMLFCENFESVFSSKVVAFYFMQNSFSYFDFISC